MNERGQHQRKGRRIQFVGAHERGKTDDYKDVKRPLKKPFSAARTGNGLHCCETETARGHCFIVAELEHGAKRNPRAGDPT
jgi:hypothetical protein